MRRESKSIVEKYEKMEDLRINTAALVGIIGMVYVVFAAVFLQNHPVFRLVTISIFYIGVLFLLKINSKVRQAAMVIVFIFVLGLSTKSCPLTDVSLTDFSENAIEQQQLSLEDEFTRRMAIDMEESIAEEYLYALTHGEPTGEIVEIHQLHHCAASACNLKTLCKCDYNSFVEIK